MTKRHVDGWIEAMTSGRLAEVNREAAARRAPPTCCGSEGAARVLRAAEHAEYGQEPGVRVWRIGPDGYMSIDLWLAAGEWAIAQPYSDEVTGWEITRETAHIILRGLLCTDGEG